MVAPAGGVALGLAVAWAAVAVRRRLDEPLVEITISLATPYLTYLVAESIGLSGILATVAAGVYVGARTGSVYAATSRLQAFAFFDVLVFLLNGVLFTLVGMELVRVVHQVPGISTLRVVAVAAVVVVIVAGLRLGWMSIGKVAIRARHLDTRERVVVGWAGMRGGLSLAAALALPRQVADGSPFPARDLILVVAAAVIVATLVLQGTTLPWLMHRLGVGREDHSDHERQARLLAARAALDWLEERAAEGASEEVVAPLRTLYASRLRHLAQPESRQSVEGEVDGYDALRLEMLATERSVIMAEHDEGRINADVLRRIEHSLDLEESRLRAL